MAKNETFINRAVGERLRENRIALGFTLNDVQQALPAEFGMNTLKLVENGKTSLRCCSLYKLLKFYRLPEDDILFFCTLQLKRANLHE